MLMTSWQDFSVYLTSEFHSKRIYRNACLVAGEFAKGIGRCNPLKFLKFFTLPDVFSKLREALIGSIWFSGKMMIIQRFRKEKR
jgi:hypothetical protein